ncbi:MAG TPA: GntR family transcriptional regulator [Candidatus Elarobacter sp.]|nr:GntR family transcriptional regulator [Candidatus Elarobacter sp.]
MTRPAEKPLEPSASKADLVYRRLSTAILDGSMKPLARLNADEIARRLGVSKIPVREALQRLEFQGLVTQAQHAGASVAPLSENEIEGIRYARLALDPVVARLAAERATPALLANVRAVDDRMRRKIARGDTRGLEELNRDFHAAIARASGFELLADLVDATLLRVRRYRALVPLSPESWNIVLDEHASIVRAIAEHDAGAAERAARDHASGPFTMGGPAFKPPPEFLA